MPTIRLTSETKEEFDAYAAKLREVGAEVGYPDQLHFSRAFKNVYGASPREWRKQNSRLV